MPSANLTARNVTTLRSAGGRRTLYFDRSRDHVPGFALDVAASGARGYFLIYRSPTRPASAAKDAPKVWLYLGDPRTVALKTARDDAREARALLARGIDPKEHRERQKRAARERPTFAALLTQFLDATEGQKSPLTIREHRRVLGREVERTAVGRRPASEVTADDIRALLSPIVKRGAGAMANRTLAFLSAGLAWGVRQELVPENVCRRVERPHVEDEIPTDERVLTDEEVARLWRGLEAVDDAGRRLVSLEAATYIRVLLTCGTRRTETALAEWRHVRLGRDVLGEVDGEELTASSWAIPPTHRKGRRGKQRGLVIPLSTTAAGELLGLAVDSGGKSRVFPTLPVLVNPHRFVSRIAEATGVPFALHDLRATCATGCGELGAAPHVVSAILGHMSRPGAAPVTSRYDRADREPEVRAALERWGQHIEGLVRKAASS